MAPDQRAISAPELRRGVAAIATGTTSEAFSGDLDYIK